MGDEWRSETERQEDATDAAVERWRAARERRAMELDDREDQMVDAYRRPREDRDA